MRNLKFIVFFCLSVCLIAACSNPCEKCTLINSDSQKVWYSGDSVHFVISSEKDCVPDSVLLKFDSKSVFTRFYNTTQCSFSTEGLSMGDRTLIFEIYKNGEKQVVNRSLRILSDIEPARLSYEVVATFNHDKKSYTQGLQFEKGKFYESAGLYGESSLRYVDVATGKVERQESVDGHFFAEGLTMVGDTLFQLTWREGKCFLYNKNTFESLGAFTYPTEGWGLCYDGRYLILTDGSEYLSFYEPKDFKLVKKVGVFDNLGAVSSLNELEYVNGFVYANIYQTDKIVKINPNNGKIVATIDFSGLLPTELSAGVDVLNGIAWNPITDNFYITGKLWPRMYEVRLYYKE